MRYAACMSIERGGRWFHCFKFGSSRSTSAVQTAAYCRVQHGELSCDRRGKAMRDRDPEWHGLQNRATTLPTLQFSRGVLVTEIEADRICPLRKRNSLKSLEFIHAFQDNDIKVLGVFLQYRCILIYTCIYIYIDP